MIALDTLQVCEDVKTLLSDPAVGLKMVDVMIDPAQMTSANFPLCDIRPFHLEPEALATGSYYFKLTLQLEIVALDLSSAKLALKIVSDRLKSIQEKLVQQPRLISSWDNVILGKVDYSTGQDAKTGAGITAALAEVEISLYST